MIEYARKSLGNPKKRGYFDLYIRYISFQRKVDINMFYLQKNTVTREYLARSIKRHTGLNMHKADKMIDQIINFFIHSVQANKQVKVRLFGSFYMKYKNARVGRNPKTMVETAIAARRIIKFKVAPTLKKRINENISLISY